MYVSAVLEVQIDIESRLKMKNIIMLCKMFMCLSGTLGCVGRVG